MIQLYQVICKAVSDMVGLRIKLQTLQIICTRCIGQFLVLKKYCSTNHCHLGILM